MEGELPDPASTSWHFDRRVPLALLATLFLQSGTAIWWASSVNASLANSTEARISLASRVDKLEAGRDDLGNRMTRVETLLGTVSDQSSRQGTLLEQILAELRTAKSLTP